MSGISKLERSQRKPHCAVAGCRSRRTRLIYCDRHYKLNYKNGSPLIQKRASSNVGVSPAFKKQFVQNYKLEMGCVDCGYVEHSAALDFDHRPGTVKVRDIKSGQHLGWQALLDEIAKCDVVCANCHRIRTYERRREVMSVDILQKLNANGR